MRIKYLFIHCDIDTDNNEIECNMYAISTYYYVGM